MAQAAASHPHTAPAVRGSWVQRVETNLLLLRIDPCLCTRGRLPHNYVWLQHRLVNYAPDSHRKLQTWRRSSARILICLITGLFNQVGSPVNAPGVLVQGTTHLNLNSGLFYLAANSRTQALMARIAARLAVEKVAAPLSPTYRLHLGACCC